MLSLYEIYPKKYSDKIRENFAEILHTFDKCTNYFPVDPKPPEPLPVSDSSSAIS